MALMRQGYRHILYDFWVDDTDLLKWIGPLRTLLLEATRESGATILNEHFHQFEPFGVTGVLLLSESHLSLHTWPEDGLATLDIFTCGTMDTELIIEHVRRVMVPSQESLRTVLRGIGAPIPLKS